MLRNSKSFILSAVLFLFSNLAFPQSDVTTYTPDWSVGLKFSMFGVGIEGRKVFSDKFHLRSGISYVKINYSLNNLREDLDGTMKFSPSGIPIIIDYWPHKNIFVSVGSFINLSKVSIRGELSESVFIGDIEMYPEEVGYINADISAGTWFSPYMGAGVSHDINKYYLSLAIETGMVFHGRPQVKLNATGMLTPTANDAQKTLIEENISPLTVYPFISFTLNYNFYKN